ncbi:MAG: metal ABC transporter substrate-binding protein [Caldisericaceae bacterium]
MKKLLILVIVALILFSGCGKSVIQSQPKYAATILPLYDALSEIGKGKIQAVLIVPPGASPHTFTVTPEQIRELQGTKAIFENDFGLEDWIGQIATNVSNASIIKVGGAYQEVVSSHSGNPHIWLNPEYFVGEARVIADTLKEQDPKNATFYETNFQEYSAQILAVAQQLREQLKVVSNRNIISFHDAFPYFAEYFGLNVVGSVEPIPGKEPTPKEIASLENTIREKSVKVIFNEPQMSPSLVNALVEDTGVKVLTLDPLGNNDTRNTYIKLLEYDIDEIMKGLNG